MEKAPSLAELAALLKEKSLERLPLRGILFSLLMDGSAQAVEILDLAASQLDADGLSDLTAALVWLAQRGSQNAADALYRQAIHLPSPQAAQAVLAGDIQTTQKHAQAVFALLYRNQPTLLAADPGMEQITAAYLGSADEHLRGRMRASAQRLALNAWLVLVDAILSTNPVNIERLADAFTAMNTAEQTLARAELARQASTGQDWAAALLARLFIEHGDSPSGEILKQQSLWPAEETLRAEVFFLAEEWRALDELDFDNRLIKRAYQSASEAVRQRILTTARRSGRLEWLEGGAAASRKRWLTDLDDASFTALISRLLENAKLDEAWKLTLHAPLRQAALAVRSIEQAGQAPLETEAQEWAQISRLAGECQKNLPGLSVMETGRLRVGLITEASMDAENSLLAVCGEDGSATFYTLPSIAEQRSLPASAGVRYLSALPIPPLDAAAAQAADSGIKVVRLSDGRVLKSMSGHNGLIKGMVYDPAARLLFSSCFDRTIRAWSFPEGLARYSAEAGSEVFALALIPGAGLLASGAADGRVRLWRTSDLAALGELPDAGGSAVLSLQASGDGRLLAGLERNGSVQFWNPASARLLGRFEGGASIRTAALPQDGKTIYLLENSGRLAGYSAPGGQLICSASLQLPRPCCLFTLPGEQLLALAADGAYQLASAAPTIFTLQPVGNQGKVPPGLPGCWAKLAGALLRARHRYDVEIGDHTPISSGDFDIFLEGV